MRSEDAIDLCNALRTEGHRVPIVLLVDTGDEIDGVIALEVGADAALAKPPPARELMARIRSILRRCREAPNTTTST